MFGYKRFIHTYIESVEYTSGYINFFYYKLKRWGRISLYLDCGRQSTRWKIHEFLSDYANAFFCVNKRSRNKVSKIKFWWVAKHNMPYHCFYFLCNTILHPLHFPMMANKTLFTGGLLSNLKLKCYVGLNEMKKNWEILCNCKLCSRIW